MHLGLIGKKVTADRVHELLQALLPNDPQVIYDFHKALLCHGQRVCVYERPRCEKCILTDLCDYYKAVDDGFLVHIQTRTLWINDGETLCFVPVLSAILARDDE
jgi:adenine-specific DNA glycosylase